MNKGFVKRRELLMPGDLFVYPFVWSWEEVTEKPPSFKMRPVVVVQKAKDENGYILGLVPVTTQPARDPSERMIVPYLERADVGMDPKRAQSIAIRDMNIERLTEDSNIHKMVRCWSFSSTFTTKLQREFKEEFDTGLVRLCMRRPIPVELRNDNEVTYD
ncbi:hypothetical protein ACEUZ9_004091 [Paracoccus litorisediminis]|uniref:hypothetical protein n=1 Tax=Paracoccus litorisediminis TaxID=2006130 RepID=UPI003730EE91